MNGKPSEKEEEFFVKREFDRRRKEAQEREAKQLAADAARNKERHWMHCPKCGRDLMEITFGEVQIDKCLGCEGAWLDAGEVDQIRRDAEFLRSMIRLARTKGDEDAETKAKVEYERRRETLRAGMSQESPGTAEKVKAEHWMRCPKCGHELVEIPYHHISVDKCSSCEGMFLDPTEIEHLRTDEKFLSRFLGAFKW